MMKRQELRKRKSDNTEDDDNFKEKKKNTLKRTKENDQKVEIYANNSMQHKIIRVGYV